MMRDTIPEGCPFAKPIPAAEWHRYVLCEAHRDGLDLPPLPYYERCAERPQRLCRADCPVPEGDR